MRIKIEAKRSDVLMHVKKPRWEKVKWKENRGNGT